MFAPHCTWNWSWPYGSLHSYNREGRSVTFLRQRPLFLLENQTTVGLSPLLTTCLSQIRPRSARLSTRSRAASCMIPMYVVGPNVCELLNVCESVPIKLTDIPIELIGGLESALEHRNSAFTRSRRTFDPSLERSSSCAHVHSNYYPGQKNRYSRYIHEIDPPCDHLISSRVHKNKSMQRLISSLWGTGTAKFQVTWLLCIVQNGVSVW